MSCYMDDGTGLEALLALDGASFTVGRNALVEISAHRTEVTRERPHGISYALVLRPLSGGRPWIKFDNAHGVAPVRQGYGRKRATYDHWHRTEKDSGRPYDFTTAAALLDDFWQEVRRALDEKGISHDL